MWEIKKIVVPVDFEQHTEKLVDFALSMASQLSASITFLHVAEGFEGYEDFVHPSLEQVNQELRDHAEKKMVELLKKNAERCPECAGKVVNGDVVDEIVAFTEQENTDLILIGTHGARGVGKILLGNIAERVAQRAPCPILMFNPYR